MSYLCGIAVAVRFSIEPEKDRMMKACMEMMTRSKQQPGH